MFQRKCFFYSQIFWFGDLNYRIENKEIRMGSHLYKDHMCEDQLYHAMQNKKVFTDYLEGDISFPPTYKFDKGTNNYDSSSKMRIPSWTDRILWKGSNVFITYYDSVATMKLSDHRPIFGYFLVSLQIQDYQKLKKVVDSVLRSFDKLENDLIPSLKLSSYEIDLGPAKIYDTVIKRIELENNGYIPVVFELRSKSILKIFNTFTHFSRILVEIIHFF